MTDSFWADPDLMHEHIFLQAQVAAKGFALLPPAVVSR